MTRISTIALRWGLIAVLVSAIPHLPRLPLWVSFLLVTSLSWRLLGAYRGWRLPARVIKWGAAIAALVLVVLNFKTINGLQAGSALLVAMLALKVLETNNRRDLVALILSAYFLSIASLLYSQHIPALLYAFLAVWITSTALLQISIDSQPMTSKHALMMCGRLLAQSIPIMLVLFLLFPRIPTPLVGLSNSGTGRTGLGEEMSPGTITNLIQSDDIAFTVRFDDQPPPYSQLYWRGPVLHSFDGQSWTRDGYVGSARPDAYTTRGQPMNYTVTLEPNQRNWLFALDIPSSGPSGSRLMWDFQLVSRHPIAQVYRYDIETYADHQLNPNRQPRGSASEVPGVNPRTIQMARRLRNSYDSDEQYVDAILDFFNRENFVYTLRPFALDLRKPVDDFIFNTRAGFCEHYASAFTVMMRSAGIPARVVTGYLGGEFNPITGHLTVRNSEAHAWSEIWLPGSGWRRVDPTAAVAPERIQEGLAGAVALGDALPGSFIRNSRLLLRLRYGYDAINIWWNDFVLGYGPEAQKALMSKIGLESYDWRYLVGLLTLCMTVIMLVLWYFLARQLTPKKSDKVLRAYGRFCAKLGRHNLIRLDHEGPLHFNHRACEALPALSEQITRITTKYVELRYQSMRSKEGISSFQRLVRDFQA